MPSPPHTCVTTSSSTQAASRRRERPRRPGLREPKIHLFDGVISIKKGISYSETYFSERKTVLMIPVL